MDETLMQPEYRKRFEAWALLMGRMLPATVARDLIETGKGHYALYRDDQAEGDRLRFFRQARR